MPLVMSAPLLNKNSKRGTMEANTKKLIDNVLELPHHLRAFLAEKLLESLDEEMEFEMSEEWKQEIRKRCQEIDEGKVMLIDSEKVFEKAFGALE